MESEENYKLIRRTIPLWHYWFNKPFKHFADDGITREMSFVLVTLYYSREKIIMSKLASKARVSKQQMCKIIDKLNDFGFVERSTDENDRRIVMISITEKGKDYIENHNQKEIQYYDEVLSLMSEKDKEIFLSSLENVHRILNELPHLENTERKDK